MKSLRRLGRFVKWLWFPARRRGGVLPATPGSRSAIYHAAAKLGSNQPVGLTHRSGVLYHEVPFRGLRLEHSRSDLGERITVIRESVEVNRATGLDLGCAVGGLTFSLQKLGASMVGVERDSPSIAVALALESRYRTGVQFVQSDIAEFVHQASNEVRSGVREPFGFVVFFNALNWAVDGMTLQDLEIFLADLGTLSNRLLMDSSLGGKGQPNLSALGIDSEARFMEMISRCAGKPSVRQVDSYEGWYGRGVYLFAD